MSQIAATIPATPHLRRTRLQIPYFRNLWVGATVSLLGDQFYFVALPWLALQITGSGLALGTILMVAAIPRAAFMLMGGVLSDRISPRRILLGTAGSRTVLVAAVAALVYWHAIRLWHLYLLGAAFGFADAFAFPAMQALIPALVGTDQLAAANALLSGSTQFSMIGGPAPAGLIMKRWGMAWAFLLDALSFLFILVPLYWLPDTRPSRARSAAQGRGPRTSGGDPLCSRRSRASRFLASGGRAESGADRPTAGGAGDSRQERFSSPAAFGTLLSSLATGGLIGTLLPAILKFRKRRGITLLLVTTNLGIGMAVIGFLHHFCRWLHSFCRRAGKRIFKRQSDYLVSGPCRAGIAGPGDERPDVLRIRAASHFLRSCGSGGPSEPDGNVRWIGSLGGGNGRRGGNEAGGPGDRLNGKRRVKRRRLHARISSGAQKCDSRKNQNDAEPLAPFEFFTEKNGGKQNGDRSVERGQDAGHGNLFGFERQSYSKRTRSNRPPRCRPPATNRFPAARPRALAHWPRQNRQRGKCRESNRPDGNNSAKRGHHSKTEHPK